MSSLQICHDSCGQPQISTPAVSQNMSWCLLTWHQEAKSSKTRKRLIEQDLCLNQNRDCGWWREWSHLSLWQNRYLIDQCCSVCFRQRSINTHKHVKYAANCYLSCFWKTYTQMCATSSWANHLPGELFRLGVLQDRWQALKGYSLCQSPEAWTSSRDKKCYWQVRDQSLCGRLSDAK